jgi:hypothetical protein
MKDKRIALLGIIIFLLGIPALGAISIPLNLSDGDQQVMLQNLGFSMAFRPVDNPAPLGLYSGLELGFSLEDMPTGDIGNLGSRGSTEKSLVYPRFTLGKGIFDNVDLFFSFAPYSEGTGVGIYSGGLRWGFFQATFVPVNFSLVISGTAANLDNLFLSQTVGADIISGINTEPFSFYIGAGTLYGQGQFDSSITIEQAQTNQIARCFHTLLGATVNIGMAFFAVELDNYNVTNYSFKLGVRL